MACLQKFASVHAIVHNHFNSQPALVDCTTYKTRSAALAVWCSVISLAATIEGPTWPIGDSCKLA